jgi:Uma2 family endonuclease
MSDNRPDVEEWLRQNVAAQPATAARYELLDGEQIPMPPTSDLHTACVMRLTKLLTEAVGELGILSVQSPLVLGETSQPCPDIAVLAPRDDGYSEGRVSAADVLLLIEVSDTSFALTHDRGRKASYYARTGIAECWIIDLMSQQVLVHSTPASGCYRDIRNLRADSTLEPGALPGVSVAGVDVLSQ